MEKEKAPQKRGVQLNFLREKVLERLNLKIERLIEEENKIFPNYKPLFKEIRLLSKLLKEIRFIEQKFLRFK